MREVILSLPRAHRLEGWILTLVLFVSAPLHAQEVIASEDSHRSSPAAVQAGIVNDRIYYPDSRTAPDNLKRFASQVGSDAISNVLKEFWPDIKHRLFERRWQGK